MSDETISISEIKGWVYNIFAGVFMALAAFSNNLLSAGIFYFLSIIFYILNLNEWGDDVDGRNHVDYCIFSEFFSQDYIVMWRVCCSPQVRLFGFFY